MTENENNIRELYSARIKNSINDSFYAENISWESKIRTLRTYEEIIVRFILNKPKEHLILSRKEKELRQISDDNELLMNSFSTILEYGNCNTNTENFSEATEENFNKVVDAIYGMYSYLFVSYFEKYGYKYNRVLTMFSLLPPIIRCKTFSFLWEKDKSNPVLIDKLNLANLKTYGYEYANNWIENNKALLKNVPCASEEYVEKLNEMIGNLSCEILASGYQNMYEICVEKLDSLKDAIEIYGSLYETYEEAVSIYKEQMLKIQGMKEFSEPERKLKELMDFCYEGRKNKPNNKKPAMYCLSELRVISRGVNE